MKATHRLLPLIAVSAVGLQLCADKAAGADPAPAATTVSAAPGKAIEVFNGKDLTGWKFKGDAAHSKWTVGTAALDPADPAKLVVTPGGNELINAAVGPHGSSVDIYTDATFGDARVELEVMVPKNSNSGVVMMGIYEIQVLDSFGRETPGNGDMGAVYGKIPPKVNAAKKPGEWQTLSVEYRAARFDDAGNKTANARIVKATLNGQVIHENAEVDGITAPFLANHEVPTGSFLLQGDHGAVAYRNIKITPLGDAPRPQ